MIAVNTHTKCTNILQLSRNPNPMNGTICCKNTSLNWWEVGLSTVVAAGIACSTCCRSRSMCGVIFATIACKAKQNTPTKNQIRILQANTKLPDRKSAVLGKRVSVRVDLGGRRLTQPKNQHTPTTPYPHPDNIIPTIITNP